ncbi:MAG: LptF/LptG family permease [Elusimicrobiota bacterium]
MLPTLPRYILKMFFPVFGACLALFLGVLMMNQFLRLFSLAMMKGISAWWILVCFSRLLPSLAALAVPMSFLVTAMVILGQLTDSGEIMALRASGFSYREITRPLFWLSIALSVLLLLINHKVGPEGFHSFKKKTTEAAQQIAKVELRSGSFTQFGPWRLYARESDAETGRLEGVYLARPDKNKGIRVNAETGRLATVAGHGVSLELLDGQFLLPNEEPDRFTSGRFERYQVFVPMALPPAPRSLDMQEMSTARLREKIKDPATKDDRRLEYRVETTVRTAGALSPFVFFWVGVPLGLGLKRRARGIDFAVSLVVMFSFYGLLVLGISLGRQQASLASIAPWLSDAAGLVAGFWLTRRAAAR